MENDQKDIRLCHDQNCTIDGIHSCYDRCFEIFAVGRCDHNRFRYAFYAAFTWKNIHDDKVGPQMVFACLAGFLGTLFVIQ